VRTLTTISPALITNPAWKPAVSATAEPSPATAERAVALATTADITARPSAPPSWPERPAQVEAAPARLDRDPAVLAIVDAQLPRSSQTITAETVAAVAGPDPDRAALIRANAALAAVKAATLAAVQLSGGPLEPADRTEILAAALRILENQASQRHLPERPPVTLRLSLSAWVASRLSWVNVS
jgi:hypothetical protein